MTMRVAAPMTVGLAFGLLGAAVAQNAPTVIAVDAAAHRHPISPLIYGVAFADKDQLIGLNTPLNRDGGNGTTTYNWRVNASNHAADWFFESIAEKSAVPGDSVDSFIADTKAAGAQAMVTIPMIGWVAKVGPNRENLPSFSVAKYGPQQKTDQWLPDAGNGVMPDGKTSITGDDPHDANIPSDPTFQRGWVQHLTARWGMASGGGVRYYLMDNEPALWNSTHRDVHPQGTTMEELRDDILAYGVMVKSVDSTAQIVAPEEWGWTGYKYSGADSTYAAAHNWNGVFPERAAHGNMDMMPWLLDQLHKHDQATGRRSLDVFTLHFYPQGGDGGDDVSPKTVLLRNRSTRALWDPAYKDESWINDTVMLIPRMKQWVAQYYPGTKTGITEYDWGAEKDISGATAQADVLGIFGREGLDLACRWTAPAVTTPTFKAMRMYRNYDGHDAMFGSVSVSDVVPDSDTLSSFAALRQSDGALTVMVINKVPGAVIPLRLALSHFAAGASAQAWQLTSANTITRLPNVAVAAGCLTATLPAQSVTLFVVPARRVTP